MSALRLFLSDNHDIISVKTYDMGSPGVETMAEVLYTVFSIIRSW